jgi:hypothetical protein
MTTRGKKTSDENYEKPSKHRQWQEKSERPIASKTMTSEQIEEHRLNLISSYQCADSDITYCFQKIQDENDEDRDDCLWLKYRMDCIIAGKPTTKDIFSIKIPIPEELKRMAEQMRKEQAARARAQKRPNLKALPEPPSEPVQEVVEDVQTARPRLLRKPIKPQRN